MGLDQLDFKPPAERRWISLNATSFGGQRQVEHREPPENSQTAAP